MRYLNPLRYIHYHTQLAIPTIYDDSLSFYEIMNKTNLHFNEVINDMNENYEIIDKAFQEVLEQTNKWMEEAKAQADRAEQEANKSQASAEASQQAAEDARNQADRAKSEADAAAASAVEAQNQADRASSEADRAHTEAENAKAQAQAAANSAQESATSAAASAGSASESAKSAEASKNSADASANSASQAAQSATASQNSAEASANSASQAAQSATASQNSAEASANSASQAAQSATDAANSAKEAADTLDEAKETFVKKAGDTMTGKLTISYGGLSVDGSAGVTGDFNAGRLQVGTPSDKGNSYLYGDLELRGILTMSLGGNSALAFSDLTEGLKLYAPLSFENPENISNVANPQEDLDAVNKQTLDAEVTSINASLSQVNENITSLTSRTGALETKTTKLQNSLNTYSSRVRKVEIAITDINAEITNIKQDITTVEGDYVKKAGDTMTGNLTMGTNQIVLDTGHIAAGNNTLLFEGYPEVDVDGAKIKMVGSPTDLMDAANKNYVDSQTALVKSDIETELTKYLPKAGGIMSGSIDMGGKRILNVDTPSINNDAATKGYVDNAIADITPVDKYLPLSGGTMSGFINMGNNPISNVPLPTGDFYVANKRYVDNAVADVSSDFLPLTGGTLTGQLTIDLSGTTDEALTLNGGLIINDNNKNAIGNISPTGVTLYQPLEFPNGGRISAGTKSSLGRILFVGDPINNTDVANKQYVDSKINTSLFYNVNNLIFHITHISDNLYKCDCYTDLPFNIDINIISQGIKAQEAFAHTLDDFLIEKGFTFKSGNETFLQTVSLSSGVSAIISARLFDNKLVIYATVPQRVTSPLNVGLTLPISFLCSALISKDA